MKIVSPLLKCKLQELSKHGFLFAPLSQNLKTFWNSDSQGDPHLGMLGVHLLFTFPHLWKCVWILSHFPKLNLFSCPSLGHEPKVRVEIGRLVKSSWRCESIVQQWHPQIYSPEEQKFFAQDLMNAIKII
jgi:hypothetical protein